MFGESEGMNKPWGDELYGTATWLQIYSHTPDLVVAPGISRLYNDTGRELTVQRIRASLGVTAQGSAVIIDVLKNGTSIFTTTANRPTIPAGQFTALSGPPDDLLIQPDDYFTVDIAQTGSISPGAGLTVQIRATVDA